MIQDVLMQTVRELMGCGVRYRQADNAFRRQYIIAVLEKHNFNQVKAARELEMHRNTLGRTLAELDLDVAAMKAQRKRPARVPVASVTSEARLA